MHKWATVLCREKGEKDVKVKERRHVFASMRIEKATIFSSSTTTSYNNFFYKFSNLDLVVTHSELGFDKNMQYVFRQVDEMKLAKFYIGTF